MRTIDTPTSGIDTPTSGPVDALRPPVVVFVESSYTGAGEECVRATRHAGAEPILLCRDPAPYAFARDLGVEVVLCDTRDVESLRNVVAGLGVVAAVGTTDEYSVVVAARLAATLGLRGPSVDAVEACRDKSVLRRRLPTSLSPRWHAVEGEEDAVEAANAIGYPVVVKPANLTGSVLVRRCGSAREVREHVARTRAARATPDTPKAASLLVEEYVDGPEFSVEFLDGEPLGVTAKHVFEGEGFVEEGHDFPAQGNLVPPVVEAALAATRAVGLVWGPSHLELRVGKHGPRVMELNARIPGDRIPRLVELATGTSMAQAYVEALLGLPRSTPTDPRAAAASIRMWRASKPGRLDGISGLDGLGARPDIDSVVFRGEVGRLYEPQHSNLDRLGYVIAVGPSRCAAAQSADQARDVLVLTWS